MFKLGTQPRVTAANQRLKMNPVFKNSIKYINKEVKK